MDQGYAFTTPGICHRLDLDLAADESNFFQIPVLEEKNVLLPGLHQKLANLELNSSDTSGLASALDAIPDPDQGEHNEPAPEDGHSESRSEIWALDVFGARSPVWTPRLCTWEAFEERDVNGTYHTAYLSESGPEVFDAALQQQHSVPCDGVLPQGTFMDALRNLSLGRSSKFFQWDESIQAFVRTLDKVTVAGLSLSSTESITTTVLDHGNLLRRLQASTSNVRRREVCAVTQALLNATARVLEALEAHVTSMGHCQSIIQFQEALRRPHHVLELMHRLTEAAPAGANDDEALSRLVDAMTMEIENGSREALLCNKLLEAASRPWLIELGEELGLVGTLIQTTSSTERASEQLDLSDSAIAQECRATMVLDHEDNRIVLSTRETVKILRTHCPGCRLDDAHTALSACAADAQMLFAPSMPTGPDSANVQAAMPTGAAAWSWDDAQDQYLQTMDSRMSTEPKTQPDFESDTLYTTAMDALSDCPTKDKNPDIYAYTITAPFDRLRPAVLAHSQKLNHMLLSYLFSDCMLREHFNVQHAFQFLGSGDFVTRLSTALFSVETQSAERRRGVVPTAQTMGLRLGARDEKKWPPASSELRLTLLGVLTDTYHGSTISNGRSERRKVDMPGGLNFAIRELPDEEIDKVMDATSLYALDFLKLQYTAPPPLDAIITNAALQRYDEMFRSLLRMLRVQYVAMHLRSAYEKDDHAGLRFAHAAHHTIAALMSYSMDIGIAVPWTSFQNTVEQVERRLMNEEDEHIPSMHNLRDMHDACLESIRNRLFLRRKHITIRAAVDDVLFAVLKAAAIRGHELERSDVFQGFYAAVQNLVKSLQDVVDKPPKARPRDLDVEVVRLLLQKLDYNGYFSSLSV